MIRAVVAFLSIVLLCAPVSAHKFHASLAEVEYNATTGSVEFAVRLFVDDLEASLSREHGRTVRIDSTSQFDAYALAYLNSSISVRDTSGARLQLAWVGKDVSVDVVWVFVEAPAPNGLDGARIGDKVFFDLFDDQVNTVIVKNHGAHSTLVFKTGDGEREIPKPAPAG
jgi:hypothetical protein